MFYPGRRWMRDSNRMRTRRLKRLKPALGNDEDIARLHIDVCGNVAAPQQVSDTHVVLLLCTVGCAQNRCGIAVRKVRNASHSDHDIEERHVLSIRQRLRTCRLADDSDLLAIRTDETSDDHGYDRIT